MVFCQWVTMTEGDLETRLRPGLLANNEMYSEIVYHCLLFVYLHTAQCHLNYEDRIRPVPMPQPALKHLTIVNHRAA